MQDCHWTADEIVKKINEGKKSTASGMLQSEMNKLRDDPKKFKSLVDTMVSLTKTMVTTGTMSSMKWIQKETLLPSR